MKVGDKVPVHIGPHEVAQAEVKEINGAEAVLIVPARRVVMGIRTELTDLPGTEVKTEHQVLGVEGPEGSAPVGGGDVADPVVPANPAVAPEAPVPPAPVEGAADGVTPVVAPASIEQPAPVEPQNPTPEAS